MAQSWRQDVGRVGCALIAAALLLVAGVASGDDPQLFQTMMPTPEVLKVSEDLGFFPIPLIAEWRFFDDQSQSFDPDKYAQKIWLPQLNEYPELGSWEKFGIPPQYQVWADLDFERWDPIHYPEEYPWDVVLSRRQDYLDLIETTRALRPTALVCLHGLVRRPLEGVSGLLVESIASQCDAVSPSMGTNFNRDFNGVANQMDIKRQRILACLQLKRDYGVKVFPVVHKRYRLLGPDGTVQQDELGRDILLVLPQALQEQMLEVILTTELDGMRIDGLIVWGKDNLLLRGDPDEARQVIPDTPTQRQVNSTDIAFLELIIEALDLHWP